VNKRLAKGIALKSLLLTPLLLIALVGTVSAAKPNVVPNLQSWTDAPGGGAFALSGSSRIVYADASLEDSALLLKDELKALNGLQLPTVSSTTGQPGDIVLELGSGIPDIGLEGYTLAIGSSVVIAANEPQGVFYGTRTVLQALKQDGESRLSLPKGTGTDYPQYRERGLMLDVARKYFTVDFLKMYIKQMAWLKMNVLHLHFSDDQGFRLESDVPGLTSPQHYTKAEIADLVAFANQYFVTLVPEIDVPAHATWITKARPDLLHACPNMAATGDLDLTNPDTLPFVKSLIDEYIGLFDADSFHIGADEYTYFTKSRANQLASLQACPEIMQMAADLGYDDPGDLYRQFINDVNAYIVSLGKRTRIWEWFDYVGSIPVSNDIIYDAWLGENDIQSKSDEGFDIINSSYHYLYIIPGRSVPDRKYLYETWEPWIWSSAPDGRLTDPADPRLIGAKLHDWNDGLFMPYVPESGVDKEIATVMKAFAERLWGSPKRASYNAFLADAGKIGNVSGYGLGLVQHYRFDETSGVQVADSSGYGVNGTIIGPVAGTGKHGGGLTFNGGSDRVFIGESDLDGEWTASMWVKREASGTTASKLLDSAAASIRLEQINASGKVGITKYGIGDYSFNYTAPIGEWTHLTFVGTAADTKLYVNGVLTGTIGQHVPLPRKTIGASTRSLKGTIDELKLFDRALDAQAIRSLYDGLVVKYGFEDATVSSVADASGLGNDAGYKGPVKKEGWLGSGLKFGGGDHFVYTAAEDIAGSWTASVWVNNENSGQSVEILMNSPATSIRIKQAGSGKVGFSRYGVADHSFNYTLPADGTWKHLAFVGDASGTSLYVNGQFIETNPAKINLPLQSLGKVTSSFKGTLDEFSVYDRSLTAAEIYALYEAEIAAKPSIAQGKPASADASEPGHGPELANDEDNSNASYWEAALGTDPSRTWQVDLQGLYMLDGVKVRTIADGTSYAHYSVEASEDGVNWTLVGAKTGSDPATDFGDFYRGGVKARFVRVAMTGGSGGGTVKLSDVSVFGTQASIAAGKTATAEVSEPGHGPELAIDSTPGNGTYWDAALLGGSGRWWQVDLGQLHRVDTVVVRNYVDGSRFYRYEVLISEDGVNWTTAAVKNDSVPASDSGDSFAIHADARYLRVNMTYNSANASVHITDFQAFGYALP